MYKVLLHHNQNQLYKNSVIDAKFVALNIASLIQPQEMHERIQIAPDDARMKFIRGT